MNRTDDNMPALAAKVTGDDSPYWGTTLLLLLGAVGFVLWRAWVCDDAFITFRHVANCLAGYGPVFNPGERVQGFTHPLWFLVLLAGSTLVEPHPLAMILGLVSTVVVILLLAWFFRSRRHRGLCLLAAVAMLLSSPTFIEYQTSGLETCLTHLLTVLAWGWLMTYVTREHLHASDPVLSPPPVTKGGLGSSPLLSKGGQGGVDGGQPGQPQDPPLSSLVKGGREEQSPLGEGGKEERLPGTPGEGGREGQPPNTVGQAGPAAVPQDANSGSAPAPAGIVLVCSLLMLDRPDHFVPCVPLLLLALHVLRGRGRRDWLLAFAAVLPLVAWYGFALVYYGSPLPNTAYAKTGIPLGTTLLHGLAYLRNYSINEPIHALIIPLVLIIQTVIAVRDARARRPGGDVRLALVLAVWLQVAYVVLIGGDFMRGRFLSLRLVATAVFAGDLVGRLSPTRSWKGAFSLVMVAGLAWSFGRAMSQFTTVHVIGPPGVHPVFPTVFLLTAGFGGLILTALAMKQRFLAPGRLAACLILAAAGLCTLFDFRPRTTATANDGIADEYAWYAGTWRESRFARPAGYPEEGVNDWVRLGRSANRYASQHGPIAIAWGTTGFMGYLAGPQVQIIDTHALTDPFIARLPADPTSRIGHLRHAVPAEYMRSRAVINEVPDWRRRLDESDPTLATEARALATAQPWADARLQRLWTDIQHVTKGCLFCSDRWKVIPRYARGR
jgi:hypothetical protein